MLIKIVNQSKKKSEVLVYDVIGGYEMNGKKINQLLNEIKSDEILVRINSVGGSVFQGFSIYNTLANSDKHVICRVEGIAASIASIIALAGDEVEICDNAYMMIHNPSAGVYGGEAEHLRKIADTLDKITETLIDIYEEKTGLDRDKIRSMMDNTTYLDSKESVNLKFADKKIGKSKLKVKIAAELLPEDIPDDILQAINGEQLDNQQVTARDDDNGDVGTPANGGSMTLAELMAALGVKDPEAALKMATKLREDNSRLMTENSELTGEIKTLKAEVSDLTGKIEDQEKQRKESVIDNAIAQRQIDPKDKDFAVNLMNQSEDLFNTWFDNEKAKHQDDTLLNPLDVNNGGEGSGANPYEFSK